MEEADEKLLTEVMEKMTKKIVKKIEREETFEEKDAKQVGVFQVVDLGVPVTFETNDCNKCNDMTKFLNVHLAGVSQRAFLTNLMTGGDLGPSMIVSNNFDNGKCTIGLSSVRVGFDKLNQTE